MAREGFVSPGDIPDEILPEKMAFFRAYWATMKEKELWQRR